MFDDISFFSPLPPSGGRGNQESRVVIEKIVMTVTL
jgi:hypothetical protein